MREIAVPADYTVPVGANLTDAVFDNAASSPTSVALSRRVGDAWQPVTAGQFARQVRCLAAGFVAAGVAPGDRVALLSRTRYEWTLADYALWTAGAVPVPVYETSSAEQLAWILADSGAVGCIVETAAHARLVEQVRGGAPGLREVWQIDAGDLDSLVGRGRGVPADDVERRRTAVRAEDLATVIYTSGTTGRPKGCELTHGNFLARCGVVRESMPELFGEDGSTLLFLPLAHVFARIIEVAAIMNGLRLGHSADVSNLLEDLQDFRPTFILAVPRVFEKLYTGAQQKAQTDGTGAIFDRAADVAVRYSEALDRGTPSLPLRAAHAVLDLLVYRRLRAALGGQVRYAISGGAPLGARLGHFFRGVGVTVLEGYGLTESTAGGTVNLPAALRIGTIGRPVPGGAVRIADDGEVLLKGGFVFRGYWHDAEATAAVLAADGWLRTGDVGRLDEDGYLRITGRTKELIVTASGKNVAPAVLEGRVRAHALVSECMVVGDGRPFVAALVTIDEEAFRGWRSAHGKPTDATVEDLSDDADLLAEVQHAVDDANTAVSRAESIRKVRILPHDFSEEGGELTPTLKLRRTAVVAAHADEIERLYAR